MGIEKSHFNVSVGSDGQSHKTVSTNHNLFEEKGEPKRSFIEKSLKKFNFGHDIKRWISTFYGNINSCMFVNGQYSEWFDVRRGTRQGDLLSPYFFLICAEILSSVVYQNKNIYGIKILDEEILSQFADDTTFFSF